MEKIYSIRITGSGTIVDITNALQKIKEAMRDSQIRMALDSPEIEDLHGAEWEDCTLMTEIHLEE